MYPEFVRHWKAGCCLWRAGDLINGVENNNTCVDTILTETNKMLDYCRNLEIV